ncbi:MAG: transcription termination/antitermination NusG family protein [Chthoniobacterales bacterium]
MTYSRAELATLETPAWFCLKVHPKREHLAAAGLRREMEVDCFAPRLRFRKMTRRGAVWFVEAMFPAYLFARFVYADQHRRILHAPGVRGVVQFGEQVATIAEEAITALQKYSGDEEVVTIDPEIKAGQEVQIVEGPFQGIHALVTRVLPAKERIRVLLEFLGRSVETELSIPGVLSVGPVRPS